MCCAVVFSVLKSSDRLWLVMHTIIMTEYSISPITNVHEQSCVAPLAQGIEVGIYISNNGWRSDWG